MRYHPSSFLHQRERVLMMRTAVIVHYETIGNPSGYAVIPATPAEVKTKLEPVLKCILAIEQLTLAGNTFPKLSILCLYLRIFPGRSTRIVTYITMCMVFVVWLGWFILGLNECTPVRKQWDRLIPKGHCYNSNHIYRSFAGPNTDPDLLILLIPLPTIWKLEASKWKKLGISILFLMASLGFVVSVVKWVVYFDHDASVIIPGESLLQLTLHRCHLLLLTFLLVTKLGHCRVDRAEHNPSWKSNR